MTRGDVRQVGETWAVVQGVSEPRKVQADRQQLPRSKVGADQEGHRVFPGRCSLGRQECACVRFLQQGK